MKNINYYKGVNNINIDRFRGRRPEKLDGNKKEPKIRMYCARHNFPYIRG